MYKSFERENDTLYTVKKGDSLYSIAKKYNTTAQDLINMNNLKNTILSVGQVLIVEKDSSVKHIGSDICKDNNGILGEKYGTYIVKKNDSLNSIAKMFKTTIANLIYINDLHNTILSVGQKILVPLTLENGDIKYIVKEGDTLYSIASDYNVTPKQIIDKNKLDNLNLSIGQLIKIPTFIEKEKK